MICSTICWIRKAPTLVFHIIHRIIQYRLIETKRNRIGIISRKYIYLFVDCLQSNVFLVADVTLRWQITSMFVNPKSWILLNFESVFLNILYVSLLQCLSSIIAITTTQKSNSIRMWYNKLADSVCPLIHSCSWSSHIGCDFVWQIYALLADFNCHTITITFGIFARQLCNQFLLTSNCNQIKTYTRSLHWVSKWVSVNVNARWQWLPINAHE